MFIVNTLMFKNAYVTLFNVKILLTNSKSTLINIKKGIKNNCVRLLL